MDAPTSAQWSENMRGAVCGNTGKAAVMNVHAPLDYTIGI